MIMLAKHTDLEVSVSQLDISVHDCTVTVVSGETGQHRTFRVKTVKKGSWAGKRLISLLTGTSNTSDYTSFGLVGDDGVIVVWRKLRGDGTRAGRTQWEKFADLFHRPQYWESRGMDFMISLQCRMCSRKLTHPTSLSTGYGPECIKKV